MRVVDNREGKYDKLSYQVAPKLMLVFILQHLLFSVTDPQYRAKPAGVSDVSSMCRFFTSEEFSSLYMYLFSVGFYTKYG